jgi:hypothetical protein
VADEAKGTAQASKKKVARRPSKVEKKANAAVARLGKAVDKAEAGLAARKKSAAKKKAKDAKNAVKKKDAAPNRAAAPEPGPSEAPTPEPVRAPEPPAPSTAVPVPEDLSALTVVQLRARARAAGHAGYSRYTKAQLMALLSS